MQTEEERQSIENGLWLCERCAALIDKNGGADFPVEQLKLWKRVSERAALERLYRRSDEVRDNCIRSLIYINAPRLHHFVALTKQQVGLPTFFDEGIPGEGYIAPQLYSLQSAIAELRFPALGWDEAVGLVDDPTGLIVSFEGRFGPRMGHAVEVIGWNAT
jgi:ribosomal protein L37AE/L43A